LSTVYDGQRKTVNDTRRPGAVCDRYVTEISHHSHSKLQLAIYLPHIVKNYH